VELGFIRVTMQALHFSHADAQKTLAEMKKNTDGFVAIAPSLSLLVGLHRGKNLRRLSGVVGRIRRPKARHV